MMSQIPVTRSSMPNFEEYVQEIRSIWDTVWLTNMGPKHQQLEKQLCKYLGVSEISLFTNGHLALEIAIRAFNLTGEVITTPYTFASTTHAIVRNGLTPVFCDINSNDYTIDTSKIEELITEKTSAIVPVHVYGMVCDVEGIADLAKKHNLKVIYDAAHAFGVTFKGKGVGNFGDAAMFSFHATKAFHTIEGGAVAFHDEQLKEPLWQLKNFGLIDHEQAGFVAGNAKMNEFQAAMGICNLRHIDKEIGKRKQVAERYRERLSGVEGIKLAKKQEGVLPNYAYLPVLFTAPYNRDQVLAKLAEHDIYGRRYFYPLITDFYCYREQYDSAATPVARFVADNILTLPMYADLSLNDVDRICDIILKE